MPQRSSKSLNALPNNPRKSNPQGAAPLHQARDVQDQAMEARQILIVDDNTASRERLRSVLSDLRHNLVEVESASQAFAVLSSRKIDIILVDLSIPEAGAIEFCKALRLDEATQMIPVFVQADFSDQDAEARAIEAGADEFLITGANPRALRARVQASIRHKVMLETLDESEGILFSLAKTVEERDPDLGLHCQRLALMAAAMGIALGLPPNDILNLQRSGYLHDIGKIGVPDRILFKPGPLTDQEWEVMRSHCERGERLCSCMKSLAPVLPIIRHHHEKWDGSGYPAGLKGEQIPLLARILQLADIYDALTTERAYKRAYSSDEAIALIREECDKGWRDPRLVEVFSDLLPLFRSTGPMDLARLSLSTLSASLEQYRKDALSKPNRPAGNFNPVQFIR